MEPALSATAAPCLAVERGRSFPGTEGDRILVYALVLLQLLAIVVIYYCLQKHGVQ